MSKRKLVLTIGASLGIAFLVVIFVRWQLAQLGASIRTIPLGGAQDVTLNALADVVLDPSVLNDSGREQTKNLPALDEYKTNPDLVRRRALLTKTWINASQLARDLAENQIPAGQILSSALLSHVAPEHRDDAWGNPYCVLADKHSIVIMSSGNQGPLNCATLAQFGRDLVRVPSTARLRKVSNILVTVQPLPQSTTADRRNYGIGTWKKLEI